MDELKIVYLSPEELTPYEKNARVHTPEDIEVIKSSIREAGGFNDPIGVWGPNNLIVEGHGRRQAALELGIEKVPCIRLDHMTDEQRRLYTLAHNRSAEMSGWDFTELNAELADLEMDFDMSKFGFDALEVDATSKVDEPPDSFKEYGEDIYTKYVCPRCGYEWN